MKINSDLLNNPLLNDITIYNILLQSNISDTINLCSLNDRTKKICNNYFWKNKYLYDHFPVINNNPLSWLSEYSKVYKAKQLANDLIILADQECDLLGEGSISLGINLNHHEDYHLFLPQNLVNIIDSKMKDIDVNNIDKEKFSLIFNKNRDIPDYISYMILDNRFRLLYKEIAVNYDVFRKTLFYLFYYYPDIDVVDEYNVSYFKEKIDLKKLYQLYEEPEESELTNNYMIIINNRIDFWGES